jgi:hypothetical protein
MYNGIFAAVFLFIAAVDWWIFRRKRNEGFLVGSILCLVAAAMFGFAALMHR